MAFERIFNIFVYFDDGLARHYGVRHHRRTGSDDAKCEHLRVHVDGDHPLAQRFSLPRSFTAEQWLAAQRVGDVLQYFEDALTLYRASPSPVFCLTSIVDGMPKIDRTIGPKSFRGNQVMASEIFGSFPDYLVEYVEADRLDLPRLINDDYFIAIRTLFNNRLYVSCTKLLMSCIDTLAFVEFGDQPGNFANWLDTYVTLTVHGINSEELWEFRNSVLHMTNLASRKVLSGNVSPIVPYVGTQPTLPAASPGSPKPLNLYGLIASVADGIGKWAESYNEDRDKFLAFVERYDLTISDSRMAWCPVQGHT